MGRQTRIRTTPTAPTATQKILWLARWGGWGCGIQPSWCRTGWDEFGSKPLPLGEREGQSSWHTQPQTPARTHPHPEVASIVPVSHTWTACVCECVCECVCGCGCVFLWPVHHPHSQISSSAARSSLQPGCVSNWHSNWQIWMPPLDS